MSSKNILSSLMLLSGLVSFSQTQEEDVMQPIRSLFLAMETNDSTLAESVFYSNASLSTVIKDDDGNVKLRTSSTDKLVSAFGMPKENNWSEPIWNEQIKIDGELAQVWVEYAFYLGNEFSHCGADAFQLIKVDDNWKIFQLADSRRKTNCVIPEKISSRYK